MRPSLIRRAFLWSSYSLLVPFIRITVKIARHLVHSQPASCLHTTHHLAADWPQCASRFAHGRLRYLPEPSVPISSPLWFVYSAWLTAGAARLPLPIPPLDTGATGRGISGGRGWEDTGRRVWSRVHSYWVCTSWSDGPRDVTWRQTIALLTPTRFLLDILESGILSGWIYQITSMLRNLAGRY